MTLPLMPAAAGRRSGRRFAGVRLAWAALLTALALGALSVPGRAQDADPYSATVTVDATAATVVKAREMARLDGQRRALTQIVTQLGGSPAASIAAKLNDNAITDLVKNFEVANERMSTVRYVADYTFHFHAAQVRRLLGNAGITPAVDSGKPVIVLPVYQSEGRLWLWGDPNPWREAWRQQPAGSAAGTGPVRLLVPLGDAGDLAAIDAEKARSADADALTAIAHRNGGDEAIVALAALRPTVGQAGAAGGQAGGPAGGPAGVDVSVRRYRAGQLVDSHVDPLDANPGESESALLARAAASVASQIESGWKTGPVSGYDQQGTLTAVLPIADLGEWVRAQQRLATVPTIRKIALVALSRQEATIQIDYTGTIDQLKASLAAISLDLEGGDPHWRLARTGPGAAR